MTRPRVLLGYSGILLAAAAIAWQLRFLCDDAYITFRYVANAHAGLGLVWNPPPFQPVEGYTGFLWAVVLWGVWSVLGVEPPAAANVLSMACGLAQLGLVAAAARRVRTADGERLPHALVLGLLAAVAANRTFVQWFTSGLETALFHWLLLGWVLGAFANPGRSATAFARWALWAALAALTRPDGLLAVAATAATAVGAAALRQLPGRAAALGLSPLALVGAHLAWRRATYGEWLPNTYYAKVGAAWPEAGLRYFACFAAETGTWLPLLGGAVGALALAWGARRSAAAVWRAHLPRFAAVAVVVAQVGYYVLVVGGDHFEYRVLSHLVPLAALAAVALLAVRFGRRIAAVAVLLFGLLAGPGWVHLHLTKDVPEHGFRAVAPHLPAAVQGVARWFDRQQAWLRLHMIGLRCPQHRMFLAKQEREAPPRAPVAAPPDDIPVAALGAVGLVGWVLPNVAIIDEFGLNDWVVARTPVVDFGAPPSRQQLLPLVDAADADRDGWLTHEELRAALAMLAPESSRTGGADYLATIFVALFAGQRADALSRDEAAGIGEALAQARSMAHDKTPPPGYVAGFRPNVHMDRSGAVARPRAAPLPAAAVEAHETAWRARVRRGDFGR